jgi:hypothetical protein
VIYFCARKNRRELVLATPGVNGIDYLEVLGDPGCGTQLAVTFLKPVTSFFFAAPEISITGGAPVPVVSVTEATAQSPLTAVVNLAQTGDFSVYTFSLVAGPGLTGPPAGIDPVLASVDFSFKAGCPSPADCLPAAAGPPALASPPPDINYLAKDYGGFLQVMLDRLAVLVPGWTETHAADLGVALTEVLAYAADHLSYQQDAVSTEAYLGTARSRISLRRHARLVDYQIGEGGNARALISVSVDPGGDEVTIPAGTLCYVRSPGLPPAAQAGDATAQQLALGTQPVFASLQDAVLTGDLNEMNFYTWGDGDCCLPAGATQAALAGPFPMLQPNASILIFEEVMGPLTGAAADADPAHRCAVRLTGVTQLTDPVNGQAVTSITWAAADALPFALCISATVAGTGQELPAVSVARGNLVLADHGLPVTDDDLGIVPPLPPQPAAAGDCGCAGAGPVVTGTVLAGTVLAGTVLAGTGQAGTAPARSRYYPQLTYSPLTFSAPFDPAAPAAAFLNPDPALAVPAITLASDDGTTWTPLPDLLETGPRPVFVPEIEFDGSVYLRFGDGQHGRAADPGLDFTASYRVGNGSAGNVGPEALAHLVLPAPVPGQPLPPPLGAITGVRNPLAASGGTDPEDMEHIRQFAPFSYQQVQERCVTEADYGAAAQLVPGVLAARGTLRWTGSWYTALASVEPVTVLDAQLTGSVDGALSLKRMMGTDLVTQSAVIVGLQITLQVRVDPRHFQQDVRAALMAVFITGDQADGTPGRLNAAGFTFGETVYASPLVAAAQAVEGVAAVTLTQFTRLDAPWVNGVAQGFITMGRLDIPRCDNDPDHLDHGTFTLQLDGGK